MRHMLVVVFTFLFIVSITAVWQNDWERRNYTGFFASFIMSVLKVSLFWAAVIVYLVYLHHVLN